MSEILSLRKVNEKHYKLDRLRRKVLIYSAPVHYKDTNDIWQDIDLNLENIENWETEYCIEKNSFKAYFNDITDPDNLTLASFDVAGRWINYKMVDAIPSSFGISEGKVKYIEVFEGVDLEYVIDSKKLKENIIIKTIEGIRSSYEFSVKKDSGLSLRANQDKSISFINEDGQEVFRIKAPYMEDAAGEISNDVEYYISQVEYNGVLYDSILVAPDQEWLNDTERVFPIYIDPTTTIDSDDGWEDTYAKVGDTIPKGSSTHMGCVWYDFDDPGDPDDYLGERAFFRFDLPEGLSSAQVHSAILHAYADDTGYYCTDAYLKPVVENWSESTLIWSNQPSVNTSITDTNVLNPDQGWNSWDIINCVKYLLDNVNYGISIYDISHGSNEGVGFYTSEASSKPYVEIEYYVLPTTAITTPESADEENPTTGTDITPNVTFNYSQTDSLSMSAYEVKIYNLDDELIYDSGKIVQTAASGSTVTHTVASELDYYTTLKEKVKVYSDNGIGGEIESEWSDFKYLEIEVSQAKGLAVVEDSIHKSLNVSWSASTEENLIGYNLYRSTDGTNYSKVNETAITDTTYRDYAIESGQTYYYKVAAVTSTGEGEKSTADNGSITYTGMWLDDLQLTMEYEDIESIIRRYASSSAVIGKNFSNVQDMGCGGEVINLPLQFSSNTDFKTFLSIWQGLDEFVLRDGDDSLIWIAKPISSLNIRRKPYGKIQVSVSFEEVRQIE